MHTPSLPYSAIHDLPVNAMHFWAGSQVTMQCDKPYVLKKPTCMIQALVPSPMDYCSFIMAKYCIKEAASTPK